MREFLCWLLGHDRMQNGAHRRSCLRCGMRETLRRFGSTSAWEEDAKVASRGAGEAKRRAAGASR